MDWFTSDTHFNHKNIIPYERPQFSSVEEMNATLIRRWNAVVRPEDTIYHLGDFALGNLDDLAPIVAQLNGSIRLCLGNHDGTATKMAKAGLVDIAKERIIPVDGLRLWMAHIPSDNSDDRRGYKRPQRLESEYDIELCGHVHSQWKMKVNQHGKLLVNVGVDVWDLTPTSLTTILLSSILLSSIPHLTTVQKGYR